MGKAFRMFFGTTVIFVVLLAGNAMAAIQTVQVVAPGGTPCVATAQYPTIQQAVNSVTAGSTIIVCPGTYAEQVTITKNLTLRGENTGTASGATIAAPSGGVIAKATDLAGDYPVAAQVLVENAARVNISDLSIDGTNNGVFAAYACGADLRGIDYQNASGTINEVSVLNENEGSGNGCQSGEGIFIESSSGKSTVKISNSVIENFQKNGITGNNAGTAVTITGNSLLAEGPAADGAAANGVQIGFGATGTVSENTSIDDVWAPDVLGDTGDAAAGILVYGSESVTITSNTVANTQYGIAVVSDQGGRLAADLAVIKSNKISGTHFYDAIEICSNGNMIEGNIISSSDQSAIHLDGSAVNGCTQEGASNTVSGNVVNTACAGILVSNNFPNSIGSNTFNNVTINLDQADTCTISEPAADVNARTQRSNKNQLAHRVRPVR